MPPFQCHQPPAWFVESINEVCVIILHCGTYYNDDNDDNSSTKKAPRQGLTRGSNSMELVWGFYLFVSRLAALSLLVLWLAPAMVDHSVAS